MKHVLSLFLPMVLLSTIGVSGVAAQDLEPVEQLGKSIFFDSELSINRDQACAACHAPAAGWTGPLSDINAHGAVYEGSIPGRFGNRKPPSSAYATLSPVFEQVIGNNGEPLFVGGNFWDGRATGETLGNPAADQAQGPFLNPLEQALPDSACVVYRVCNPVFLADYPVLFEDVWQEDACAIDWPIEIDTVCETENKRVELTSDDRAKSDQAYNQIALSIAAFEDSVESNAYTAKYDYFLAGMANLTRQEKNGLNLFRGKGKCIRCHALDRGPNAEKTAFTDFTFHNLGVPRNPENPFYLAQDFNPDGYDWVDRGLGGFLETRPEYVQFASENIGKQKVPTLRNVALGSCEGARGNAPCIVKAYTHNGYFKSLKGVVHFYNTRDVKPECPDPFTTEDEALAQSCWPEPEIAENVNTNDLGDLRLTERQENAIVAFLKTLSDGYVPDSGAGNGKGKGKGKGKGRGKGR